MNKLLEKIHTYLINRGQSEENLKVLDSNSVYLAMEIMEYAHRNQKRVNNEDYANHPMNCLTMYRKTVGIVPNDYFSLDVDLLYRLGIPFDGVQEVCLLHDVVEDSDITFDEVRDIFIDCGFERYFDLYISDALKRITHVKGVKYDEYIDICMGNPISSLVKMFDMQDNLNNFSLIELNERIYKRNKMYLKNIYKINSKFKFIERINIYKNERDLFINE